MTLKGFKTRPVLQSKGALPTELLFLGDTTALGFSITFIPKIGRQEISFQKRTVGSNIRIGAIPFFLAFFPFFSSLYSYKS